MLLYILSYSITLDEIKFNNPEEKDKIEIHRYYRKLKEINTILQILNNDLYIYFNEMYIIDELVTIIELLNYNIERINEIKIFIIESALTLQKYDNSDSENQKNDTSESLIEDLNKNFEEVYDLIKEEKEEKTDNNYYDKLRYILFKEIKKTSSINYRYQIFEKLIKEE